MELHSSPTVGKKLWNVLRIAFFMMRKGLVSKRKLIMDMNLMMQRGKLLGKSLGKNLTFHPHHASTTTSFGLHDYEFSCTNSPNPNFFRVHTKARKHSYFPCMGGSRAVQEQPDGVPGPVIGLPRRVERSPKSSRGALVTSDPVPCTPIRSPFSVRVSNYSLVEEEEEEGGRVSGGEVDNQAEEFIKRFYQQLNAQGQIALLQYQEEQYQEMLARGT